MSESMRIWRRRPTGIAARLIWPIAAIVAMALGLVVATVVWTSEGANAISIAQQQSQVAAALDDLVAMRARQFSALTVSHEAQEATAGPRRADALKEAIGNRAIDMFGFDVSFVLEPEAKTFSSLVHAREYALEDMDGLVAIGNPLAESLRREVERQASLASDGTIVPDLLRDMPVGRLVFNGRQSLLVVASAVSGMSLMREASGTVTEKAARLANRLPIAIGIQWFDRNELAVLGARRGIEGLEFITREPRGRGGDPDHERVAGKTAPIWFGGPIVPAT